MNTYSDFCVIIPEHGAVLKNYLDLYYKLANHMVVEAETSLVTQLAMISEDREWAQAGAWVTQRGTDFTLDADESPNWDVLIQIIQVWMKNLGIEKPLVIEFNHSGDRPAPNVCGGGVMWIWKGDHFCVDTADLLALKDVFALRKFMESQHE